MAVSNHFGARKNLKDKKKHKSLTPPLLTHCDASHVQVKTQGLKKCIQGIEPKLDILIYVNRETKVLGVIDWKPWENLQQAQPTLLI